MWSCNKNGSRIEICSESGEIIATVGSDSDPRINGRVANAKLMALAPEMLDVLIDLQELVRRECFENEHPLAELIKSKVNNIVNRSFHQKGKSYEEKVFRKARTDGGYFRPRIICNADMRTENSQEGSELSGCGEVLPRVPDGSGCEQVMHEDRWEAGSGNVV